MATAQLAGEEELKPNRLPERAPPPFIGVLGLFPQYLGGKGYHMATKEEAGCTIKLESMDAVHGRGRRHQSCKATVHPETVPLALWGLVVCPTVTSSLERSGRRSP